MSRRLLERLRGIGGVYAGDELLRTTSYELSIWSESASRSGEPSRNALTVEGRIGITGAGEAIVLAAAPALTLILEDGRRLAFTLLGTDGRIAGAGAPEPAR